LLLPVTFYWRSLMSTTLVSTSGSVTHVHLPFLHVITFHHDMSMTRSDVVTDITLTPSCNGRGLQLYRGKVAIKASWQGGNLVLLHHWWWSRGWGQLHAAEYSRPQPLVLLCFILCRIILFPIPTLNFTLSPFHYASVHRPRCMSMLALLRWVKASRGYFAV